jgi:hypothetical protein
MKPATPPSALIGIASCVASFLAGVAYADGFVRASAQGPAIAVFTRDSNRHRVDFAPDGEHFAQVLEDPNFSIYDVALLADGTLVIAREERSRRSVVRVTRVEAGTRKDVMIQNFATPVNLRFASSGEQVVLAGPYAVFRSHDGGRSWASAARWRADGYAFYAASMWLRADGDLEILAPVFNTCGSSDLLEDLQRWKLAADGASSRAMLSFEKLETPWTAFLGRHGFLYTTTIDERGCSLRVHADNATQTLETVERGACYVAGNDNGRFTVFQFGSRLYRAGGGSLTALGDGGPGIVDVYPDHRGRALVLYGDGRLLRYGATGAPIVVRGSHDSE